MGTCHSCPPLGSHTCRTPHDSFPPSFTPGLIPTPATTLLFFLYTHPQTLNLALRPALIPNPKMLILLTACGKGSIGLKCCPWLGWLCIRRQKHLLWVAAGGDSVHAPGKLLAGGEAAALLTPRRAQASAPLPPGSPSEPAGGGAQPKSGLRRDEGRSSMGSRSWRLDGGGGVESSSGGLTFHQMALGGDVSVRKMGCWGQSQPGHDGRGRAVGILQLLHNLVPSQPLTPGRGTPASPLSWRKTQS